MLVQQSDKLFQSQGISQFQTIETACLDRLPDTEDFINLLVVIFFDGIESENISLINSMFSPNVRDASPLFFLAVAIPPDINQLETEDQERFLTNGLHIEGMIPGLSEVSFINIFKRSGDFLIRGNLALFNANAFREIGKWLEELKHKIGWQKVIYSGNQPPSHPIWAGAGNIIFGVIRLERPISGNNLLWEWMPWRALSDEMLETRGAILLRHRYEDLYINNYSMEDVWWCGQAKDSQMFEGLKQRYQVP